MTAFPARRYLAFRALATSYWWEPIFVLFMMSRGLAFVDIMWLSLLYSAVAVAVELPTGIFADRVGRVASMTCGALALAGAAVVAACATGIGWFAAAEVLLAISLALCSGADSAYLYDALAQEGQIAAYPRLEATASSYHLMGTGIAVALGGVLSQWSLVWPYVGTAITACVAAWLAWGLPETRPDHRPRLALVPAGPVPRVTTSARRANPGGSWWRHFQAAVEDLRATPRLLWLLGSSAVVFVLVLAGRYLYQPLLSARGLAPAIIGPLLAATYMIAGVVAWHAAALRSRFSEQSMLWGVLAVLALSFALFNQTHGMWVMALIAVQVAAKGVYTPLIKLMLNREIAASARRATVLSFESMARRLAMGVFSPIVGYLGVGASTYVCGVMGFVGIGLLAHYHGSAGTPGESNSFSGQPITKENSAS